MTLYEAMKMIERGETPDEYKKRMKKLRKLSEERDFLMDAVEVLKGDPRCIKKELRLAEVLRMIDELL